MRQIERAAEHVAELVMQSHAGGAETDAAKPFARRSRHHSTRSRPLDTQRIEHISLTCKPLMFAWNARSRSGGMVAHDAEKPPLTIFGLCNPSVLMMRRRGSGDEFDECSCVRV